jgi:hypothetical protein
VAKHLLSKSTYIKGLQCHKALYLTKHYPEWRDKISAEQKALFNRGHKVGELAQQLFPKGKEIIVKKYDYATAVKETLSAIANGITTIYEATFNYNGTLVMIDILNFENGKWNAYEVKSSLKITPTYINDAALQFYVIKNCLPELQDIFLVSVNGAYVMDKKLDIQSLFKKQSVKMEALQQWDTIANNITTLTKVISAENVPTIDIGTHCYAPYTCDFKGTCWKNLPTDSVFEISEMSIAQKVDYFNKGKLHMADVVHDELLTHNQKIQLDATVNNKTIINTTEINKFISAVNYPLAFIDFEVMMPAVPLFNGHKPYQQLPFLYSMHYKYSSKAELLNTTFIANTGTDPCLSFITQLIKDTEPFATLLVYDTGLEQSALNWCKTAFPHLSKEIAVVKNKMVDLKTVYDSRWYYHKKMQGSLKLKHLAEVLLSPNPYTLCNIQTGAQALTMYEDMQTETDMFKIIEMQDTLVNYCIADSLAVAMLYEQLLVL